MHFEKYHGAGNDFILIDDRSNSFLKGNYDVKLLCDRHFGIGADGLMLLQEDTEVDFKMVYFNSDGNLSSMCGNGGRCIVQFAHNLGIIDRKTKFTAVDGLHQAVLNPNGTIALEMLDVDSIEVIDDQTVLLDTGSPHIVRRVQRIDPLNLLEEARKIRYNDRFKVDGVNVNFVSYDGDTIAIRTYERGVEDETLACGTGVTAAAIAMNFWGTPKSGFNVKAVGGDLHVSFQAENGAYNQVWKTGPVKHVFSGSIDL